MRIDCYPLEIYNVDTLLYTNASGKIGIKKDTIPQIEGIKQYELSNHLGNVMTTISDRKYPQDDDADGLADWYASVTLTQNDYYPFGMVMPGRSNTAGTYRFGIQQWEKDDEIKGFGNSYTTYFREFDVRIGRTWSRDPKHQFSSPYISLGNSPIVGIDPDGAWFWESQNVRQARKFARQTGGDFEKYKGGSASVNVSGTEYAKTHDPGGDVVVYNFKKGQNRKELIESVGVGAYEADLTTRSGWDYLHFTTFVMGDAWAKGWGEYDRGNNQAPTIMKAIANTNLIIGAVNSASVLKNEKDIYNQNASSAIDKTLAITGLMGLSTSTSVGKFGAVMSNSNTAGEIINDTEKGVQFLNDLGGFDDFKKK